ncbi:OmpA family protein [Thermodesulfobacteriota bacterium]
MKAKFLVIFIGLLFGFSMVDCFAVEDLTVSVPDREATVKYQVLEENTLLVSVNDKEDKPIRGLVEENFVILSGIKKAKIISVESLESSKEVGLNFVLVVDNSYSMKNRKAIEPLLEALDGFLKILRPIDNVQVVVFDEEDTLKIEDRTLRLRTFNSSNSEELRKFFRESFKKRLSTRTFLYEAMFAGIYLAKQMPEKSNKYVVVFSDGEDINSNLNKKVVEAEVAGMKKTEVYAVDYMPTEDLDPFLKSFSINNGGKIWKAKSAENLIPIFNAVSSRIMYRYIVQYRFLNPPTGTLGMEPPQMNFDMLTTVDGSPLPHYVFFERGKSEIPEGYSLYEDSAQFKNFDKKIFKTAKDRYKNILNIVGDHLLKNPDAMIRITGCNSGMGVEKDNTEISRKRAENVRRYLIEVCGIDASRMDLNERNLPLKPSPDDKLGGSFENQRVEVLFISPEMQAQTADDFIVETGGNNSITIIPKIEAEYGVSDWGLEIRAGNKVISSMKETGELKSYFNIPLSELGISELVKYDKLQARIDVKDINNDSYETVAPECSISVSKNAAVHEFIPPPHAELVMEPESINVEEVTTIDSSPLLNYVFYSTGESKIPDRYILFKNQSNTEKFKESELKDTMSKYVNVINIIGERLRKYPEAEVKLVGCNSNYKEERGKKALSLRRAEELRAYLRYIWGIDQSRIEVEARNLPAHASTSRVEEGRVENQRVEIYSDTPEILDTSTTTYVAEISDADSIKIRPHVQPGYGIEKWSLTISAGEEQIQLLEGMGEPSSEYIVDLRKIGFDKIGASESVSAQLSINDVKSRSHESEKATSSINYIRREERVAQKMGYKVVEKYALILFDFDSDVIKERNSVVLERVIMRINELPSAKVTIVGHTDIIGKEKYNIKLSKRRAKSVYEQVLKRNVVNPERISHEGYGPHNPPYENALPEGRSFNRTVTILLEYEQKEL